MMVSILVLGCLFILVVIAAGTAIIADNTTNILSEMRRLNNTVERYNREQN